MDKVVYVGCYVHSLFLRSGMSDYYRDSIRAFNAMEKRVLVSCCIGNASPSTSNLSNVTPWITTMGTGTLGTLDRDFPTYVVLRNGKNYIGVPLYGGKPLSSMPLPIVSAENASNSTSGNLCISGMLIPKKVTGKIILCNYRISPRVQKGYVVHNVDGAGMVLTNTDTNSEELVTDAHLLPIFEFGEKADDAIRVYLLSKMSPTASIVFRGGEGGSTTTISGGGDLIAGVKHGDTRDPKAGPACPRCQHLD